MFLFVFLKSTFANVKFEFAGDIIDDSWYSLKMHRMKSSGYIHTVTRQGENSDLIEIEKEMLAAAEELDFERAAFLRDQLKELKEIPEIGSINKKP